MVTEPIKTNFLYRFEAGSNTHRFTKVAMDQDYDGEEYLLAQIDHTSPTFSGEASQSEIDVSLHESNAVAQLFTFGTPAYPIKLRIYEYDRELGTVDDYYRGWVVRPSFRLDQSIVDLHCKTVWHYFERESFSDSLSALSRYSVYDPRSGVDLASFRVGVTVTAINDERDILTVTGISEIDTYFTGGMIVAPDTDKKTILKHVTESGDKKLYLNAAFPEFTLAVGFTADIYPGDDLTYDTWANRFGAVTNSGEAFGGWIHMPNVDPSVRGVI